MRILYIAPRYHTNQIPIMKGLREHGDEICFFSHYAGKIEDYSYVTPEIIGYSVLYRLYDYIYVRWLHRKEPLAGDHKLLRGFPPILKLNRKMRAFAPELVIIRERSAYSMMAYILCRVHHYKALLYNQSPLWIEKRNDFAHRIVDKLTPQMRITPVKGSPAPGCYRDEKARFVPFVMEVQRSPEQREYLRDGIIHLLTVGKYEERKNLQMMVNVFENLKPRYPIQLIIVGECTTKAHQRIYEALEGYIAEHEILDVSLLKNLNRKEMEQQYENADLFVIPSTREPASISQLEAMAFSVPVVCSDSNGTACYVQNGYNGFLFKDNDKDDLQRVVEGLIREPESLRIMGNNGYLDVKAKYQFSNYYHEILECMKELD